MSSKRLIGEALGMAGIPGVSRATATYHAPSQDDRVIGRSMESAPSTLEKTSQIMVHLQLMDFMELFAQKPPFNKSRLYRHTFHLKALGHEKGTKKCLTVTKLKPTTTLVGDPLQMSFFSIEKNIESDENSAFTHKLQINIRWFLFLQKTHLPVQVPTG